MKSIIHIKAFLIISFFASLFLYSCKGNEIYPIVPAIVFKDAYVIYYPNNTDSSIIVSFTYKDGDGDIGLVADETNPPYNIDTLGTNKSNSNRYANNIWVDYYNKINGIYSQPVFPFRSDTINNDVRIGNLTPDGTHKAIRGEIQVQIFSVPRDYPNHSDTIKLKIRLVDRALHISNVLETPDLYLVRR
ncbi:MAG: hypothetical protein WCO28_11065 [Bacteroidota bacterium]